MVIHEPVDCQLVDERSLLEEDSIASPVECSANSLS